MQLLISPTLAREPVQIIAKKSDKYPPFNVRFLCGVQVVKVPDPFIHGRITRVGIPMSLENPRKPWHSLGPQVADGN
jgi:hypothetical protein